MARFTAQGLNYPDACQLINTLRLAGIEANITAGGVAVCPEPQQATQAQQICKASGASFNAGYSAHQEDVMLRLPPLPISVSVGSLQECREAIGGSGRWITHPPPPALSFLNFRTDTSGTWTWHRWQCSNTPPIVIMLYVRIVGLPQTGQFGSDAQILVIMMR